MSGAAGVVTREGACPDTDDGKHCLMEQRDGYVCAPCGAVLDKPKGHYVVSRAGDMRGTTEATKRHVGPVVS